MSLLREEREAVRYDYILVAAILLLTLLGLVTLYSASYLFALNQSERFRNGLTRFFPVITSGWTPLISNCIACGIMLILFPIIALSKLDLLKNGKLVTFLVLFTIVMNLLPFFAPGGRGLNARRWIFAKSASLSFQPSELIKVVLPLYLAYILDKNKDKLNTFVYGPLPPACLTIIFCSLILLQSNLSDVILVLVTSLAICFIAGIRLGWFLPVLGLLPAGYLLISFNKEGRWYQRIANHFTTELDPEGAHYQILLSVDAIQSGGFWGKGIGQGTLKTRIPEVHGDFVFASFTEESGLLGVLLYIILLGIFAFISYYVAWRSKDRFSQLLAFGLITSIVLQSLMNIAVVGKIIVPTGVPLPFVSSGGSSLLVTLTGAALLVNLTRHYVLSESRGE